MPGLKKELSIALRYKSGKKQLGISLFLAIIVMTLLLAIVLGLSKIFIGQLRMMSEVGYSVIALDAADAGIEAVLMYRNDPLNSPVAHCTKTFPCSLGEAQYYLDIQSGGQGNCPSQVGGRPIYYCITSIGLYRDVRRAIEITY